MNASGYGMVTMEFPQWLKDPSKQAEFLERLEAKIEKSAQWSANYCRIPNEWQDVAQDVRLELCERLNRYREKREESPLFSQPTPEQAADVALKTYVVPRLAFNRARMRRLRSVRASNPVDETHEIHSGAAATHHEAGCVEFIDHLFTHIVPRLRLNAREREALRHLTFQGLRNAQLSRQRLHEAVASAGISANKIHEWLNEESGRNSKNHYVLCCVRAKLLNVRAELRREVRDN